MKNPFARKTCSDINISDNHQIISFGLNITGWFVQVFVLSKLILWNRHDWIETYLVFDVCMLSPIDIG